MSALVNPCKNLDLDAARGSEADHDGCAADQLVGIIAAPQSETYLKMDIVRPGAWLNY